MAEIDNVKENLTSVAPRCAYFGQCGGCAHQDIAASDQLTLKQQHLLDLLAEQQVKPQSVLPPLTGPIWHYRYKARLGVKYVIKKGRVLVGFREKNGRYIADMQSCSILEERVSALIPALQEMISQLSVKQSIPQIEVAVADKVAFIVRHLSPFNEHDNHVLQQFAEQHQVHFYSQSKGLDSIYKLYPNDNQELLSYDLTDWDINIAFHPSEFSQINPTINNKMIGLALELMEPSAKDQILDLFCGIGNFTLPLAKSGAKVVGVESNAGSIARAQANASANGLAVQTVVADLYRESNWLQDVGDSFNKLLLDPPRSGALLLIPLLAQLSNLQRIVYVSCNPKTFAVDAAELIKLGFQLDATGIMDMFPHTKHSETIALFTRSSHGKST